MNAVVDAKTVYCQRCGAVMEREDRFCRKCGWDTSNPMAAGPGALPPNVSDKKRLVAAILCFLLGVFGVHRFYAGKIGTGFLWLFTLGFLGLGMLADLILILAGEFKDSEGRKIYTW
jgi:hypothetical protein